MSAITALPAPRHDQFGQPLDEVTERGLAIYDKYLREFLESKHLGEVVAIHLDTAEYAVAVSSPEAMRAIRQIHPSGLLFLYTIGPTEDRGLARRMLKMRLNTTNRCSALRV